MAKMTEDELLAITGNEIRNSVGYRTGRLSEMRRRNLQFYLGKATGELAPPEIEGRSSVVDTSVMETVEWMLPSLLRTFTSGDDVVEFVPEGEEDTEGAEQTTAVANYVFYRQNNGFKVLQTWFKDALISKVGIIKVWYDDRKNESREEYVGLNDIELAKLADEEGVKIVQHSSYPDLQAEKQKKQAYEQMEQQFGLAEPKTAESIVEESKKGVDEDAKAAALNFKLAMMPPEAQQQYMMARQQLDSMPVPELHDVAIIRTTEQGKVRIENVPPEEFIISRDAKSIADARFVGHQVLRTVSDLRAAGYKDVDDLTSDDNMSALNAERIERTSWNDETGFTQGLNDVPGDPSLRQVWVTECYIKVDYDGDGIAEWRKVVRAGNKVLDNDAIDMPPLISITPIELPHQFFGLCPADLAVETQKQKTAVMRALLDNLYLTVNGRYYAVDGQVNLDDLLTSRPGSVVRMKQPGMAGRLDQGQGDMASAQFALEYLEQAKENRTGWSRMSQGLNPDALRLNQTATGMNIVTNRGDMRLELIARNFAETGVKTLFQHIIKLLAQHQSKSMTIRLNNRWVDIDPSAWRNQYDMTINVGLGTGNKDQQVQHLMMVLGMQKEALQVGMVGPEHIHHTASKLVNALGFKNEESFFPDPRNMPPQQPKPDPEQMKIQAEQAKVQAQLQAEQQKMQMEMQQRQAELQQEGQLRLHEIEKEAEKQTIQAENDMRERQHKAELDAQLQMQQMQFDQWKAQLDAETKVLVAQIAAQNAVQPAQDAPQEQGMNDALAMAFERFTQAMTAPKMIVHDELGNPVGVQSVMQ
jgi:hypothetical protein